MSKRGDDTKERLRQAALELFVANGITETSTREIAQAAGIAEGTLYRHYPSKDALALDLFQTMRQRLSAALEAAAARYEDPVDKAEALIRCYIEQAEANWPLFAYHLLYQNLLHKLADPTMSRPTRVVRRMVEEAQAKGLLKPQDPSLLTAMVLGLVQQVGLAYHYGMVEGPLSRHTDRLVAAARALMAL